MGGRTRVLFGFLVVLVVGVQLLHIKPVHAATEENSGFTCTFFAFVLKPFGYCGDHTQPVTQTSADNRTFDITSVVERGLVAGESTSTAVAVSSSAGIGYSDARAIAQDVFEEQLQSTQTQNALMVALSMLANRSTLAAVYEEIEDLRHDVSRGLSLARSDLRGSGGSGGSSTVVDVSVNGTLTSPTLDGTISLSGLPTNALLFTNSSGALTALTSLGVDDSGNLLIGTSTAQEQLTVASPIYLADATPTTTNNRLYSIGGSLYWNGSIVSASSSANWSAGGGNVYRPTGSVGIGTTSPYAELSVVGDIALTGGLYDSSASLGSTGYILQTDGSSVSWVATSTLGLAPDLSSSSIQDLGDVAAITEDFGDLLYWNGAAWADIATSALAINTDDLVEGSNLFYTDARARAALSETITGITYTSGTGVFSLDGAYTIPLAASTTNWNVFYDTPSTQVTAGTGLSWTGNTLNAEVQSSDLTNYLLLSDWYATTTDGLAEGASNVYYSTARFAADLTGTTTDALSEGSTNLYWTDTRFDTRLSATTSLPNLTTLTGLTEVGTIATGTWQGDPVDISSYTNFSVSATGLGLSGDSLVLIGGYGIPLIASSTNWNDFYNDPSTQITAGTGLSWSSNTINLDNDFGASIDESELNISAAPTDGYVLQASSTAAGGFVWQATSSLGIVGSGGGASDFTDLGDTPGSYSTGDIFYAASSSALVRLAAGGDGTVLKISGGVPTWGADIGGSGGSGVWATSTNNLLIYPADTSDVVVVGGSATTASGYALEVLGDTLTTNITATDGTYTGNVDIDGVLALGNAATAGSDEILNIVDNVSFNDNFYSIYNNPRVTASLSASRSGYASYNLFEGDAISEGANDYTAVAVYGEVQIDGSSSVESARAGQFVIDYNSTTGTGDNAYTLSSTMEVIGGATISNGYGYFSDLAVSGTVNNYYGIFLQDVVEGTMTNSYAFWTNESDVVLDGDGTGVAGGNDGGSDLFFGEGQDAAIWYDGTNFNIDPQIVGGGSLIVPNGNFGVGTSSPYATLSVSGDIALTGGLYDSNAEQGVTGQLLSTTGAGIDWVSTSTLAINTDDLVEGSNLFFTNARVASYINSSTTLLTNNTEATLESFLSDVTDVFTNNDTIGDANISDTITASNYLALTDWFATTSHSNLASLSSLSEVGTIATGTWQGDAVGVAYGGTGIASYSAGDILYATGATTLANLGVGADGTVLKVSSGLPSWGADIGGGSSVWATSSNGLSIYPNDASDVVVVGASATSSTGFAFEVSGNALVDGIEATEATTSALTINSERFTDLTGDGLQRSGISLAVNCSDLEGNGIQCSSNNFALDFTEFDTDSITEGSTNFWGKWGDNFGKLYFAPAGSDYVGIGDTDPDYTFEVAAVNGSGYFGISSTANSDGNVFEIDGSGNVGINDNTPSYRLDVNGTFRSTGLATFDSGINVNGETITDFTGSGLTNSGGALTVGNIATSSLDIAGTYVGGYLLQASTTASGGYAWVATTSLGISDTTLSVGTDNQIPYVNAGGTDLEYASNFVFDGANLGVGTSSPATTLDVWGDLQVATSGASVLFADATSEEVGIGTSNPEERLHVSGGNILLENNQYFYIDDAGGIGRTAMYVNTFDNFYLGSTAYDDLTLQVGGQNSAMVIKDSTGFVGISDFSGDAHLEVSASGGSGGAVFMASSDDDSDGDLVIVNEDGTVGIGTTSPASTLDVWGDFRVGTGSTPILLADTASNQLIFGTTTPYGTDGVYFENTDLYFRDTASAHVPSITANSSGFLELNAVSGNAVIANTSSGETLRAAGNGVFVNLFGSPTIDFDINGDTDTSLFIADASSDRIGIGTSTPSHKLSVAGDTYITGSLIDNVGTAGTNGQILQTTGSGFNWVATSSLGFNESLWNQSGTNINYTAGNVAVGTTSTAYKLDVWGAGRFTRNDNNHFSQSALALYRERADNTDPNADFGVGLTYTLEGATDDSAVTAGGISVNWETDQTNDTTARDSYMSFYTMQDNTEQFDAMVLTSNGRLGIGTATPTFPLHIYEGGGHFGRGTQTTGQNTTLRIGGASQNAGNDFATINFFNYDNNGSQSDYRAASIVGTMVSNQANDDGNLFFYTADGGDIGNSALSIIADNTIGFGDDSPDANFEFSFDGQTGGTGLMISSNDDTDGDLLTILESGDIGIGTTSPSSKLDIWGGLVVGTSSTPTLTVNPGNGFVGVNAAAPSGSQSYSFTANGGIYLTGGGLEVAGSNKIFGTNTGTDTGLSFPASNTILLESSNNDLMRMSNASGIIVNGENAAAQDFRIEADIIDDLFFADAGAQLIGVATDTPGYTLTVAGDIMATGALYDNNYSAGTNGMVLQSTGTGFTWVATSSLGFTSPITGTEGYTVTFDSSGAQTATSSLFVATNNSIGVGTTTPQSPLHVIGNTRIDGLLAFGGNSASDPGIQSNGSGGLELRTADDSAFVNVIGSSYYIGSYSRYLSNNGLVVDNAGGFEFNNSDSGGSFRWDINSSEKMRLNSSGYLGIGTSSPASLLDVWGDFRVGTSSTPNLYVGNVGGAGLVAIGTATPSASLTIESSDNGSMNFYDNFGEFEFYRNENSSAGPLINFYKSRGTKSNPVVLNNNDEIFTFNGRGYNGSSYNLSAEIAAKADANFTGASTPTYIAFSTTPSGSLIPQERMRLDAAGNLGIGTTSPGNTLSVNGTTYLDGVSVFDGVSRHYDTAYFGSGNESYINIQGLARFASGNESGPSYSFNSDTDTGMYGAAGGTAVAWTVGGNTVMMSDYSENIGIGTTSPASKLDVWGGFEVGTGASRSLAVDDTTYRTTINGNVNTFNPTNDRTLNIFGKAQLHNYYASAQANDYATSTFTIDSILEQLPNGFTVSRDTVDVNDEYTFISGIGSGSITGNTLDVDRSVTVASSETFTVSGALANFVDDCTPGSGTCNSSADVLALTQAYTSNTGAVLNITSASTNNGLVFRANDDGTLTDTSPFVIDQAGQVGVQQLNPQVALHVGSTSVSDSTNLLRLEDANSTCNFNADSGSPSCGSDLTLKKDVEVIENELMRLVELEPSSWLWKTDNNNAPRQFGFIAQDVEKQFPELVTDSLWVDGTTRKFLNTGGLMPYVVGAVKEQQETLEELMIHGTSTRGTSSPFYMLFDGEEDTIWEKMVTIAQGFGDGILELAGLQTVELYARDIEAETITTEELCVGETCISEAELIQLLNGQTTTGTNQSSSQSSNSGSNSNSNDNDDSDSDSNSDSSSNQDSSNNSGTSTATTTSETDTSTSTNDGTNEETEDETGTSTDEAVEDTDDGTDETQGETTEEEEVEEETQTEEPAADEEEEVIDEASEDTTEEETSDPTNESDASNTSTETEE